MAIEDFFTTAVTVITPGSTTDRYQNSVDDWDAATEADTYGWVHDVGSTETQGARDTIVTTKLVRLPADTSISGICRVRIDGQTFAVDGAPRTCQTPAGPHHLAVNLTIVDDLT